MEGYQGTSAIISGNKSHQTAIDQLGTEKQPPSTLVTTYENPTSFIAELDSTPIEPKKSSLHKGPDSIAVKKPANFPQDTAKARVAKLKDPAVLVNLPTSPSAQAYECAHAQTSKDPGNDSYFDPVFVDVDESTTKETDGHGIE